MTILVTGGAGYIGSHTVVELLNNNHDVIIVDNLFNSSEEAINRIKTISSKSPVFYKADVLDTDRMEEIFDTHHIDVVIHFAGYKAVGESCGIPLDYYNNNVVGTIKLLKVMEKHHCKRIVFSSSATVYGIDNTAPYTEEMPTSATNPYGWTKVMIEQILRDYGCSRGEFSASLLRYFNPIGAHESGLLGDNPNGIPNNLMPYISRVASGSLEELSVFGDDYDTIDGTGVRDYIHVVDLAKGHLRAVDYIMEHSGTEAFNLGTGHGISVLQLVKAFEAVSGVKIPYRITDRREGDIATSYADVSRAEKMLGWKAELKLKDMCRDTWNFTKNVNNI